MSLGSVALRLAAVVLLGTVAILLVLAGRDVLAWSGQTDRANVAVARFSGDPGVWEPETVLPTAVTRTLLGAGDDVEFGRALQRLQRLRGRGRTTPYFPPKLELARLELAFDEIGRRSGRADVRARAQQIHALLFFQQLLLQGSSGDALVSALERTIVDLQRAVRVDPENAEAQFGLEWLLDLYRPISIERPGGLLVYRGAKLGSASGGGGSPGTAAGAGGF